MEMDGMWTDPHPHPPRSTKSKWMLDVDGWIWMDIRFHPFTKTCFIGFLSGLESMYELLRVSNHDYGSISPLVGVARCHGIASSPQQRSRVSRPHESPNLGQC